MMDEENQFRFVLGYLIIITAENKTFTRHLCKQGWGEELFQLHLPKGESIICIASFLPSLTINNRILEKIDLSSSIHSIREQNIIKRLDESSQNPQKREQLRYRTGEAIKQDFYLNQSDEMESYKMKF